MDALDKGHVLTEVAKASLIAFAVGVINFGFEEGKRALAAHREREKERSQK